MKATVLFFDHTAALGGGEIALWHLVGALDRERFEPVVVLAAEGPLREKLAAEGVETHVLPLAPGMVQTRKESLGSRSFLQVGLIARTLLYVWRLARFARRRRVDLMHTNSLKSDLIGGLAARLARVPVVWHIRDRIEEDYLPRCIVAVFRRLARLIPHGVVANSAATLCTLQLPAGAGRVVHDGVQSTPEPAAYWPAATPLIGIVGRLSPWKGQHIFLQAAAVVRARWPAARFQIIGAALFDEVAYEKEIHALVEQLGLAEAVKFTGFRSDVPDLIARLDVLAHASTTGEPFGLVVAEGMMAGRPVVATRGGGVPEIIEDGVSGLLVPMGDAPALAAAIISLLENPGRAAALAEAGRRRILDHFTIARTARQMEKVFAELLQRQRGARQKRRES